MSCHLKYLYTCTNECLLCAIKIMQNSDVKNWIDGKIILIRAIYASALFCKWMVNAGFSIFMLLFVNVCIRRFISWPFILFKVWIEDVWCSKSLWNLIKCNFFIIFFPFYIPFHKLVIEPLLVGCIYEEVKFNVR